MLHRSLIGHIPDVCSMICAKLLAAALVIRARIISNTVLTWPFEDSLRSSVSPMDGGQSGGTFGTVIMNNNIHCDYANCHITSTAAAQCLTGEHFDPLLIVQIEHTWNVITSFRWLTYVL